MSRSCVFCTRFDANKEVYSPTVIRFLCQELTIDFDKTFADVDPLSVSFPFCTHCDRIFVEIGRIQKVLEEAREQLAIILSTIGEMVNLSNSSQGMTSPLGPGTYSGIPGGVNKNCDLLRAEIMRWVSHSRMGTENLNSVEPEVANRHHHGEPSSNEDWHFGEEYPVKMEMDPRADEPGDSRMGTGNLNSVEPEVPDRQHHGEPSFKEDWHFGEEYPVKMEMEPRADEPGGNFENIIEITEPPLPTTVYASMEIEPVGFLSPDELRLAERALPEYERERLYNTTTRVESSPVCTKLSLPCDEVNCTRWFDSEAKLNRHKRTSHQKKTIRCEACPEKCFTNFSSYLNHIVKVHEQTGEKLLSCRQCRKEFVTLFMLDRHQAGHELEAVKPLSCEFCYVRYGIEEQDKLESHMQAVHLTKPHKYHCTADDCSQRFQVQVHLRKHERKSHPELFIYSCTICDKAYSVQMFLETHVRTHADSNTVEPFGCCVCSKQFSTPKYLADHLLLHTGEDKIQCTKCSKMLEDKTLLKIHMVTEHGAKKPYECPVCKQQYKSKSALRYHGESHEDPANLGHRQLYECNQCAMQFNFYRNLKSHRRSVHKPPARICEVCGKPSRSIVNHMRSHTGDKRYVCYFCHKRFVRKSALDCHIYTHTAEKPFICHICHAEFNQPHCLKGHISKVHKKGHLRVDGD